MKIVNFCLINSNLPDLELANLVPFTVYSVNQSPRNGSIDIFAPLLGAPGACGERGGILCGWNWIDWV